MVDEATSSPRGHDDRPPPSERPQQQTAVKVVESTQPEPAVRVSRTDPAQLHQLVSRRIEQSFSSQHEQSATVTNVLVRICMQRRTIVLGRNAACALHKMQMQGRI